MRPIGRLVLDRIVDNFFAETEQVAFCTQNVVPGIDFTNDPLLQGRNFSYLDTQLKRLGSPNFTHIPVNAPEVPGRPLPAGRPHGDDEPGRAGQLRAELVDRRRRADRARIPDGGYPTFPRRRAGRQAAGAVRDVRRPLQPGPPVPRQPDRRSSRSTSSTRSCSSCRKVRDARDPRRGWSPTCATSTTTSPRADRRRARPGRAAGGDHAGPAPPITDLPPSAALSIVDNGPAAFAGRKVGALVTDGTDAALARRAAQAALDAEGARARADRPEDRRRHRSATATLVPADQKSTAARRCSTTRSP